MQGKVSERLGFTSRFRASKHQPSIASTAASASASASASAAAAAPEGVPARPRVRGVAGPPRSAPRVRRIICFLCSFMISAWFTSVIYLLHVASSPSNRSVVAHLFFHLGCIHTTAIGAKMSHNTTTRALPPSLSLPLSLSLSLYIYIYTHTQHIHISNHIHVYDMCSYTHIPSIYPFIHLSIYPSISPSLSLSPSLSYNVHLRRTKASARSRTCRGPVARPPAQGLSQTGYAPCPY